MKSWMLILFALTNLAHAETVATSGDAKPESDGEITEQLVKVEDLARADFNMPVVSAGGRFEKSHRKGSCFALVEDHQEAKLLTSYVYTEEQGLNRYASVSPRDYIPFGTLVEKDELPLRRGDIQHLVHGDQPPFAKLTYDGSVLRKFHKFSRGGKAMIGVMEYRIDDQMTFISEIKYREYEGSDISNAKPTENAIVCQDLVG